MKERRSAVEKLPPSEAQDAIIALHEGKADALVVRTPRGEDVYTLESASRPYRMFVEQMQEGALSICGDGSILYCNRRFAEMVGGIAESIVGRFLDEFVIESSLDEYRRLREQGSGATARGECTLNTADGPPLRVQLTFSPLRPRRLGHSCVIVTDLTHVERHEQMSAAMKAAEAANFAKDEFLAMLSHELRTPLSAVLGWAQLLRKGTLAKEDVQRGLEVIERNARAQMQLISDLLDVSRITSGKLRLEMSVINPAEVAANAVEATTPFAQQNSVILTSDIDQEVGLLKGDPDRLRQAIVNLLNNAVKFTPAGGSAHLALKRVNGHIELIISDTGRGICKEFLQQIFDRFQQVQADGKQNSGLGLGLFITRQVIEMHGGQISAFSDGPGKGATFVATLPLANADDADVQAQQPRAHHSQPRDSASQATRLDGVHVLVVDDAADSLSMIEAALTQAGAKVRTASSTAQAYRILADSQPDVLISDLDMPDESGLEFIRRIRREGYTGHDLPAVALTAMARPEDSRRAILSGFQLHVAKPVEHDELLAAIAGVSMRRPSASGAS